MSAESSRARLVELLWQLKQNYDREGGGRLRFIHFNTLLNDSEYRAEVIEQALTSDNPASATWAASSRPPTARACCWAASPARPRRRDRRRHRRPPWVATGPDPGPGWRRRPWWWR